MAVVQLTSTQQQALRELAHQWGAIIARRTADGSDVAAADFATLEDVAHLVGQAMAEGTLEALLARHSAGVTRAACPACGQEAPVQQESRPVVFRGGGTAQYAEPVAHCPSCRRDFFPLATEVAAGQPRL